ncbi:MAG: hypothetical protein ACYCOU_23530 [Sulfobacillus sp.]
MTSYHPNSELVTCAWIGSIPDSGFAASMIATQAPDYTKWPVVNGISQFITCRVVGGTPKPPGQAPLAMPVMEIKCWATRVNSDKPPWFAANNMAEIIRLGMYSRGLGVFGRALTIQNNNVTYNPAVVLSMSLHTEPRKIYNDPGNFAVYQFDMSLVWKEVNLVISN